ncbi:hypothetical protein [Comamonas badia]|uniref:hypothetical protein n=1 Tax=Comamonas badia TaxID=265291 RepID=UPI0004258F31|nr:hypothetical protein [Comamonas badia]
MPIANVIQRGSLIYVYNERNQVMYARSAGHGPNDGLKGYTSQFVNVQIGKLIYTYNDKGQTVSARNA